MVQLNEQSCNKLSAFRK